MAYPTNYALTHGFWVEATNFPDPRVVTDAPDYNKIYPGYPPGDLVTKDHRGLDTAAKVRPDMPALGSAMPLYALEDGIVIETTENDGTQTGTFVWGLTGGISVTVKVDSIKKREVCYAMEHMSRRLVNVGDRVTRGMPIGYQGNTGVSYGAHCHTTLFLDRKYIDPTPYVFGEPAKLLRLKEVYADPVAPAPVPTPTKEMTVNVIATFKYTDSDTLNIRKTPSTTAAIVGSFAKNATFDVTSITYDGTYAWGALKDGRGYVALKSGNAQWCVPVAADNGKTEIDRLTALVATEKKKTDALNAKIVEAVHRIEQVSLLLTE